MKTCENPECSVELTGRRQRRFCSPACASRSRKGTGITADMSTYRKERLKTWPSTAYDTPEAKEARRLYHLAYREQNRDRQRGYSLKHKYGLSLTDRRAMEKAQGGKCASCGTKPKRLVVDHDHSTGKVRGLLCDPCNLALGLLGDSADAIRSLLSYVEAQS